MPRVAIAPIIRVSRDGSRTDQDLVAVEAPLSIELSHQTAAARVVTALGLFMRTPGDDEALAMGLLHAEGMIRSARDISSTSLTWDADQASATLRVTLAEHVRVDPEALARSNVASTACGLCGRLRNEIGTHFTPGRFSPTREITESGANEIGTRFSETSPDLVFRLPDLLREAQAVFAKTGGLHAAAFFDRAGALVDITEDVGRHNAVDKLVGRALIAAGQADGAERRSPANGHILVVSGRVAYEIVQKAAMAGVATLVAVGAPSSLAVQAARETGITLIGFAKDGSYNLYG